MTQRGAASPAMFAICRSVMTREEAARHRSRKMRAKITFCLTSCGRLDLLRTTLNSFFLFNDYPIEEYFLVEDPVRESDEIISFLRKDYPMFEVILPNERLGQLACIDLMYARVKTEYIFHCEDDWEFYRSDFIRNSLEILETMPRVLQVQIRNASDINDHPVDSVVFHGPRVGYSYLQYNYLDIWHGFSFNPGLRRLRDYELVKPYSLLDGEHSIGEVYKNLNFKVAVLKTPHDGYVRHMGEGRRVKNPVPAAPSSTGGRRLEIAPPNPAVPSEG
jgi:hypothetical protein